jgi:2-methylcitrate dehydratase PrpD
MNKPSGEPTLAQAIGLFAANSTCATIPAEVLDSVQKRVMDTLGICLAASTLSTSRMAREWACEQGGAPQAHAIGVRDPLPASLAAFVNGTLAHSLDYDDTHLPSVMHPSAPVIPAALAAAELAGATGAETLAAIAVGLETCVRIGMAGYDASRKGSTFFEHGQHATSICGALGAAVAAAKLLRMTPDQITHSLAVAASMGSGLLEANRTGGTVKRIHCGWAAHAGVSAATLVRHGLTGPPTVLEGRFGFFEAWLHGVFNVDAITDRLGSSWLVPDIFFKPYPANHFTHTAIDAAIELRTKGLTPQRVRTATLAVASQTVRTIGEPLTLKQAPASGYAAQFSGPYAVAVGLFGGGGLGAGIQDYTDALAMDPDRRELMAKVIVVADPRCDEIFPFQFPAILSVQTVDGQDLRAEVLVNRGGAQRPLSAGELERKFRDNAGVVADTLQIGRIEEALSSLSILPDLQRLSGSLQIDIQSD